uniref:Uncharacterized protein n=1 Tax=Hemiselmis andersenii TaxID=464988 RepID=A0A7S1EH29_HEMAN|mmetsp:Transcript_49284/g.119495  ORF Transcript_49284/g.119495 Transcript_49284/m.119495 type:complete len:215 (+) Transcript_49284:118-762(+)
MEGNHRSRQKVDPKLRLEDQLVQIMAREGSVKCGKDDELNEECERLSRVREDKINALMAVKGPPKGASRNSMAAQRKCVSDEFETQMQDVQERLLKELDGERKRIKEEMANRADATGVQAREKRKTRTRVDPETKGGANGPASANFIINRLIELEGKVILNKDELDDDLVQIRREGGGAAAAKGKSLVGAPPPASDRPRSSPLQCPPSSPRPRS